MLTFTYELTGVGWASATIADEETEYFMRVSALSEALTDLTQAVVSLLCGAEHASCRWQDEPGYHDWAFDRQNSTLNVTIVKSQYTRLSRDGSNGLYVPPDDQRRTLFSATCPLRRFAGQVLHQLWLILSTIGVDGYKVKWSAGDFPLRQYERLEELIQQSSP